MALLRMQFGMEGQESKSSAQEAKKTKLASLPAYTPQIRKAEAEALKTAAAHIEASTHASLKVVLRTDALSVLQALQSNRDTEINDLSTALASFCRRHEVTLQWIPSHCNLPGNEAADSGKGGHNKWIDPPATLR